MQGIWNGVKTAEDVERRLRLLNTVCIHAPASYEMWLSLSINSPILADAFRRELERRYLPHHEPEPANLDADAEAFLDADLLTITVKE